LAVAVACGWQSAPKIERSRPSSPWEKAWFASLPALARRLLKGLLRALSATRARNTNHRKATEPVRTRCPTRFSCPDARRAVVQLLAFSLVLSAAPILASTVNQEESELRCEVARRELERELRHAHAQCRRLGGEAAARGDRFDEKVCAERAERALRRELTDEACASLTASAADEDIGAETSAPTERGPVALPGGTRELTYSRVDGLDVLEGDIVLGKAVQSTSPGVLGLESTAGLAVDEEALLWPNATIPYDIDSRTPAVVRERILAAIEHWNSLTLVRLRPRTADDEDVLLFYSGESSCWAELGRQGGVQLVNLGTACQRGNAIHEIGHAIGLLHEHTRADRDRYVTVRWDHVDPAQRYNFEMTPGPLPSEPTPLSYDIGSIMHYGSYAFSADGQPTIVRRDGTTFVENREALSAVDVGTVTGLVLATAGTWASELSSGNMGRCLLGNRSQSKVGVRARMRGCQGRPEGRWHLYSDPHSGDQLLVNDRSRQCLAVPGASPQSDVQARLLPCDGSAEQRLDVRSLPGGALEIRSAASGLCLGTVDSTGRELGKVVQAPCTGATGQRWAQS
jgi:hypothetical protein